MIKVLFVCHGNICRSPMAESIFSYMLKEKKLEDKFIVFSAATSREEIGNPPHYSTVKKLKEMNIPLIPHRAIQMTKEDFLNYDYIIGMDYANIKNIEKIVGCKSEKIKRLLSFAEIEEDIADPWYTGNFDKTYEDIEIGLTAFLKKFLTK